MRHRSKSSLWFGGAESAGDVIDPLRPRALRHLTQAAGKMSGETKQCQPGSRTRNSALL